MPKPDIQIINMDGDDDAPDFIKKMISQAFAPKPASLVDLSNEDRLAMLRAAAANYAVSNPFVVGQIIAPRKGYNIRWAGRPCIVVEVFDPISDNQPYDDHHSTRFGRRLDIRILSLDDTPDGPATVPFWAESWTYEPWSEDMVEEE